MLSASQHRFAFQVDYCLNNPDYNVTPCSPAQNKITNLVQAPHPYNYILIRVAVCMFYVSIKNV